MNQNSRSKISRERFHTNRRTYDIVIEEADMLGDDATEIAEHGAWTDLLDGAHQRVVRGFDQQLVFGRDLFVEPITAN